MKTKTLVTTIALAGAFMASATVARANASLTAASGTQTFTTTAAGNPYMGGLTLSSTFTDGWKVSVSTADVAGGPPTTIDLDQSGSGKTMSTLTITIKDGYFLIEGPAVFDATGSATSDLKISVKLLDSAGVLLPTTLLSPTGTLKGVSSYDSTFVGYIGSQLGNYTEILTITPTKDINQAVSLDSGLTVVPDGGMTLALLGSVFAGVAGLRSKFGSKKA